MGDDAIVIEGGGELYAQTIRRASRLAVRRSSGERGVRGPRDEAEAI
jgi:hypothetical protein